MERKIFNRRTIPLWADLALVVASLCGTTHMKREMADGLSFGGFFVLFLLFLLELYFLSLIGSLVLLPLTIRSGKIRFAAIAAVLQIPASIPWLWLVRLVGYPFSWFELLMIAGNIVRVAVLICLAAARPGKKDPH